MSTFSRFVALALAGLLAFIIALPCRATTNAIKGTFTTNVSGHDAPGGVVDEGNGQMQILRVKTFRYPDYTANPMHQDISAFAFAYNPPITSTSDHIDDDGNSYRYSLWGSSDDPYPGTIVDGGTYRLTNTFTAQLKNTLDGMPNTTHFPIPSGSIPSEVERYLQAGPFTQSDEQDIIDHAIAEVSGCSYEYEAVMRIMDWCIDNLTYTSSAPQHDALWILSDPTHRAQCAGYSHMAISMARAAGIPARFVGGFSIDHPWFIPGPTAGWGWNYSHGQGTHAWVEIYYPDTGWIPYDPQLEHNYVDTHVYKACVGIDMDERYPVAWSGSHWDEPPTIQRASLWNSTVDSDNNQLQYFDTYPTPNKQAFADYVVGLPASGPVDMTVQNDLSEQPGIQPGGIVGVTVDGSYGEYGSPYTVTVDEESWLTISALSPQNVGGHWRYFDRWSDGGHIAHDVQACWGGNNPYTAYFVRDNPPQVDVTVQNDFDGSHGGTVRVDGIVRGSPYEPSWDKWSVHTIEAISPQMSYWRFDHWSDGGDQTHDVQPGGNNAYTAFFAYYPPPDAPTNLHCGWDANNGTYDGYMYWDYTSSGHYGFHIWEVDPPDVGWYVVATRGPNVRRWCKPNSREDCYAYYVTAYNNNGDSEPSNVLEWACGNCPDGPACPYLYVWDGKDFVEDNTLLAESQACDCAESDVTDYYKLEEPLVERDGRYVIQIREFEREHSYIDGVELLVVDHAEDILIGLDPDGGIVPYKRAALPISCLDRNGVDRLDPVCDVDAFAYPGHKDDCLVIEFPGAGNADPTIELVGKKKREHDSIHLQISSEKQWETIATVHPRENWSTELIDLSPHLPPTSAGLNLRLLWTSDHDLDYVGLVQVQTCDLKIHRCRLESAIHSTAGRAKESLAVTDGKYIELVPGEKVELSFSTQAEPVAGYKRSFILVSTGYYVKYDVKYDMNEADVMASRGLVGPAVPIHFSLSQNCPNPFNTSTEIAYALPRDSFISLKIYNAQWQLVRELANQQETAGYHSVSWDGKNDRGRASASGVYFCQMKAGEFTKSRSMTLLK